MLVLGLVFVDAAADVAGCHDSGESCAVVCHGASCGNHLFAPKSSPLVVVHRPAAFLAYEPEAYALLLPRPHFRPPRPA